MELGTVHDWTGRLYRAESEVGAGRHAATHQVRRCFGVPRRRPQRTTRAPVATVARDVDPGGALMRSERGAGTFHSGTTPCGALSIDFVEKSEVCAQAAQVAGGYRQADVRLAAGFRGLPLGLSPSRVL